MSSNRLYRFVSHCVTPMGAILVAWRTFLGKEEKKRTQERFGKATITRPEGKLIWIHGASVGESLSALPLINMLTKERGDVTILMTCVTVSAANILKKRLPSKVIHQYSCYDIPLYVERFINHWRPDCVLWLESELWLNQLEALHRRGTPLLLLNGRLSKRSFKRWQLAKKTIMRVLSYFDVIIAQSEGEAQRFAQLSGRGKIPVANLKFAPTPFEISAQKIKNFMAQINDNPCWLAASTHEGEEDIVINVHKNLRKKIPNLLTILAPRHAVRGDAIAHLLRKSHVRFARRAHNESIGDKEFYLADSMGELALFYEVVPVAFIGGSLVRRGGHNPLEGARAHCALLLGTYMDNFRALTDDFIKHRACLIVHDEKSLRHQLEQLFFDKKLRHALQKNAFDFVRKQARVLDIYRAHIEPFLP